MIMFLKRTVFVNVFLSSCIMYLLLMYYSITIGAVSRENLSGVSDQVPHKLGFTVTEDG